MDAAEEPARAPTERRPSAEDAKIIAAVCDRVGVHGHETNSEKHDMLQDALLRMIEELLSKPHARLSEAAVVRRLRTHRRSAERAVRRDRQDETEAKGRFAAAHEGEVAPDPVIIAERAERSRLIAARIRQALTPIEVKLLMAWLNGEIGANLAIIVFGVATRRNIASALNMVYTINRRLRRVLAPFLEA